MCILHSQTLFQLFVFWLTANFALAYIGRNLNKFGEHRFGLRKINSQDFRIATRRTSREINRRILLNLVREHQPISRADLARRMQVARGGVSLLVNELIAEGLVYEGATGESGSGTQANVPSRQNPRPYGDRSGCAV